MGGLLNVNQHTASTAAEGYGLTKLANSLLNEAGAARCVNLLNQLVDRLTTEAFEFRFYVGAPPPDIHGLATDSLKPSRMARWVWPSKEARMRLQLQQMLSAPGGLNHLIPHLAAPAGATAQAAQLTIAPPRSSARQARRQCRRRRRRAGLSQAA